MRQCPTCLNVRSASVIYCPYCTQPCPHCQRIIVTTAVYCPYCTRRLRISLPAWFYRERAGFLLGLTAALLVAFFWLELIGFDNDPVINYEVVTSQYEVTRLATLTADAGQERLSPADQMKQRYVPAGNFLLGSNGRFAGMYLLPPETLYLPAFWIDQTEITNRQYAGCVLAGHCQEPPHCSSESEGFDDSTSDSLPVVCVNWYDAQAYCQWAGRRLIKDMEWEKAARGIDGRTFPWGEDVGSCETVNYGGNGCRNAIAPVGTYSADVSPYGALDMGANVQEWVLDWYRVEELSPTPTDRTLQLVRGSNWYDGSGRAFTMRRTAQPPQTTTEGLGFRCAEDGD